MALKTSVAHHFFLLTPKLVASFIGQFFFLLSFTDLVFLLFKTTKQRENKNTEALFLCQFNSKYFFGFINNVELLLKTCLWLLQ